MKVIADYQNLTKIHDLEIGMDSGERFTARIGNTVVDVSSGYKGKRAFIDIYPYDDEEPYGVVVNDNQASGVYWRDGDATSK